MKRLENLSIVSAGLYQGRVNGKIEKVVPVGDLEIIEFYDLGRKPLEKDVLREISKRAPREAQVFEYSYNQNVPELQTARYFRLK